MQKRKQYLLLIVGTFLMGIAYKCIYDTAGMVTGGFSGIAIIVKNQTQGMIEGGVPLWLTNTILNVPVFIVAYIVKGKKFVTRTLIGTILLTVYLGVLPNVGFALEDLLLTAIFGGIINGIGIACVFLAFATTGGTDMIAAIIQNYVKHYSIARIMQVIDGLVVIAGAFIFDIRKALYAVIAIYVTTFVSDRVIDGLNFAKGVYIISDEYEKISQEILSRMHRGVTLLDGKGMFSNQERPLLFCVVSKKESVLLKEIAKSIDSKSFIIVSDVREVMGEGFGQYSQ